MMDDDDDVASKNETRDRVRTKKEKKSLWVDHVCGDIFANPACCMAVAVIATIADAAIAASNCLQ